MNPIFETAPPPVIPSPEQMTKPPLPPNPMAEPPIPPIPIRIPTVVYLIGNALMFVIPIALFTWLSLFVVKRTHLKGRVKSTWFAFLWVPLLALSITALVAVITDPRLITSIWENPDSSIVMLMVLFVVIAWPFLLPYYIGWILFGLLKRKSNALEVTRSNETNN